MVYWLPAPVGLELEATDWPGSTGPICIVSTDRKLRMITVTNAPIVP